jgi:hypothetical protein
MNRGFLTDLPALMSASGPSLYLGVGMGGNPVNGTAVNRDNNFPSAPNLNFPQPSGLLNGSVNLPDAPVRGRFVCIVKSDIDTGLGIGSFVVTLCSQTGIPKPIPMTGVDASFFTRIRVNPTDGWPASVWSNTDPLFSFTMGAGAGGSQYPTWTWLKTGIPPGTYTGMPFRMLAFANTTFAANLIFE